MRRRWAIGLIAWFSAVAVSVAKDGSGKVSFWNFDRDAPGTAAKGFSAVSGEWKVVADDTAPSKGNALAMAAGDAKEKYNVVLVNDVTAKDLNLIVHFRAVAGKEDQGGGLVWRAKDANNYYIARYNPLEDNFRLYKVVDGKREQLATADVQRADGWRMLRVVMEGDHIECYLDGKKLLDVHDATFGDAGKIGLWTKADAQTHFDDLTLAPK